MRISWEVEDGYVGKSRPQSFEIDDAEIQECKTVDYALQMIEEYTQQDFENKVSWTYRDYTGIEDEVRNLIGTKP